MTGVGHERYLSVTLQRTDGAIWSAVAVQYREALKLRQIWCEGTFAAQKRGHNLTRVLRRGFEAAEDHCLLSAAVMNLKRMIKYTD